LMDNIQSRALAVDRMRKWRIANPEKAAALRLKEKLKNAKPERPKSPIAVAREAGEFTYFPGQACKKGHIGPYSVSEKRCIECRNERAKIAYSRDLIKSKQVRREYYSANRLKILSRAKSPEQRQEATIRMAQWKRDNPERSRSLHRNRKAKLRSAEGSHTGDDIKRLFIAQKGKCAYCAVSLKNGYHVDHIVAIANGGSNDPRNLQLACAPCNMSKGASHPIDFARRKGRLL
jgi:5-methylcytosine-specific restriction endonuclease McrA